MNRQPIVPQIDMDAKMPKGVESTKRMFSAASDKFWAKRGIGPSQSWTAAKKKPH